ncbi:MAG: hypothetical protein ACRDY6_18020 [Acidimicrobiia bacterium]
MRRRTGVLATSTSATTEALRSAAEVAVLTRTETFVDTTRATDARTSSIPPTRWSKR